MSDTGKKRKAESTEESVAKVDNNRGSSVTSTSVGVARPCGKPSSTTAAMERNAKRVRQENVVRLSKKELGELTTKIISTLQVDGPQTLHSISGALKASQVYVARVLDVLLSTPIVAVSKNSKQEIVYRYCHGKKLPFAVDLKTLKNDVSTEMDALSKTYDLLIQLRSLCSAQGKSSLTAEDEKQLLSCIEQVTDLEAKKDKSSCT